MPDGKLINTSDMLAVHGVFRSTLPGAAPLVGGVTDGDVARAATLANYYENVLDFLHAHHNGEDELIWPRLLERCPEQADVVERIAAQHRDVVEILSLARVQLAAWSQSGDQAQGAELVDTLTALDVALCPHLDEEEATILPLCAAHMSESEWAELPAHGFAHFGGDKPWVIIGLLMDQLPEEARQQMLVRMPPPAREMWTTVGHDAYGSLVAELHSGN